MATDVDELRAVMRMELKPFMRDLQQMHGVSGKAARKVEQTWLATNRRLDGIGKNMARSLVAPMAGIGAALGARELIRLTDTWTDLNSRVALAAGGMEQGAEVMGRLGDVARRTYSSLEQTAEGYLLNATAMRELGYSTSQTLDYTEAVNNALVISGAKGQRAEAVTNALSKAMAGGKLQGDNLNTVIEQGGRVAEALAQGLGVGVNQLRALGAQGKITGRDLVGALSKQMERLRREAEEMPATISDGIQLLNNALLQYVGNADSATGISAKISEALVIMADNFNTTADAGLQLAAIFAAGLLGRSIMGMVRTLGLGSAAIVNFTRALTAARSMASLSVAFGGLAAAAGPAGVVIGAGLATALVVAQANAQAAEERTARLNVEFERLGLRGKQAAEGVEEAKEALDTTADEARVQILKDINHELERMRGGGAMNPFANWFGAAKDDAKELGAIIRQAGNALVGSGSADSASYQQIMQIAAAVRDSKMGIEEAIASAQKLQQVDLSEPVSKLNTELIESLRHFGNLRSAEFASGQTAELDELTASAIRLTDQYDLLSMRNVVDPKQLTQIDDIRDRLKLGGEAAEQALRDLLTFANANPDFAGLADRLNPLIARLDLVIQRTREAMAAVTNTSGVSAKEIEAYKQYGSSRVAGRAVEESSAAYIREAERRAALGKDQLALENEIARVREKSLKDGEMLTEAQIKRIAQINLEGEKGRTAEGKKPKQERDAKAYQNLTQRINESITAIQAENAVLAGMNPLVNDYGFALETARVQQELLTAAKKAGVEVDAKLQAEIAALAEKYAFATVEAEKLSERHDEIRRKAEDALGTAKDVTRGLIDGLIQGASAADMMSNALKKIGDHLINDVLNNLFKINNAGGSGGGFLSGLLSLFGGGGGLNYGALSASGRYLFDKGGYTGPGGKHQPAGVVHKGEVVFSQDDVRRHGGVASVEAMRRKLPGYANGGPVALRAPVMPKLSPRAESSTAFSPTYHIDARGAQAGVGQEIADAIEAYDKGRKARLRADLPDLRRRGRV